MIRKDHDLKIYKIMKWSIVKVEVIKHSSNCTKRLDGNSKVNRESNPIKDGKKFKHTVICPVPALVIVEDGFLCTVD